MSLFFFLLREKIETNAVYLSINQYESLESYYLCQSAGEKKRILSQEDFLIAELSLSLYFDI